MWITKIEQAWLFSPTPVTRCFDDDRRLVGFMAVLAVETSKVGDVIHAVRLPVVWFPRPALRQQRTARTECNAVRRALARTHPGDRAYRHFRRLDIPDGQFSRWEHFINVPSPLQRIPRHFAFDNGVVYKKIRWSIPVVSDLTLTRLSGAASVIGN